MGLSTALVLESLGIEKKVKHIYILSKRKVGSPCMIYKAKVVSEYKIIDKICPKICPNSPSKETYFFFSQYVEPRIILHC